jgi:hypothetical protein
MKIFNTTVIIYISPKKCKLGRIKRMTQEFIVIKRIWFNPIYSDVNHINNLIRQKKLTFCFNCSNLDELYSLSDS